MRLARFLLPLLSLLAATPAAAAGVVVAVAANALEPVKAMVEPFEKATGHHLDLRPGSTGELYAQIENGAPYDVFLSADVERPEKLEQADLGVAGTRFTYVIGTLVLWSRDEKRIGDDGAEALREGEFAHLAIADPKTAPYGAAAVEALQHLDLWTTVEPKVVYGQNISQTLQFISTGNAELGFVALSQIDGPGKKKTGSRWRVPAELHEPIRQDAILLRRAEKSDAAKALLSFLRGEEGAAILRSFGYEVPSAKP